MDYTQAQELLGEKGQLHVLKYYEELSGTEKQHLLNQVAHIDWNLIEAIGHNEDAKKGAITPLDALEVDAINAKKDYYSNIGLDAVKAGKIGAVLLAGGQGTRLGLDKPKGMVNVGLTKELYLFEMLIRNITDVTDAAGAYVPLYIMTSEKNNDDTIKFFEEHNYFGYPKDYIKFFIQEMVPAVDYNGKLLMESKACLATSPNGNGGWYLSMQNCGILDDVHARGLEWINVFSVDNVLQRIADPVFVGVTLDSGCVSGAKVVRKAAPDERVGVLCLEDGKPSIIEYYEMTEDMANLRKENGDLVYNFGVTLNYLFRIDHLTATLDKHMPLHIVEKKIPYIDDAGNYIRPEQPNGYKFETLVLDMIHLLDDCIPCEIVREQEFAPIKNATGVDSLDSARELLQKNGVEL